MGQTETINIEGMSCAHCEMNIKKTIAAVDGVKKVEVSLAEKKAVVTGNYQKSEVINAIVAIGYKVVD